MSQRPIYTAPAELAAPLRAKMEASAKRKWVWVAPSGAAFWLNNESTARNSQKAEGGEVFPPIV